MLISVINLTHGGVSDQELQRVIRAINRQIRDDFYPYWSISATLRLEGHVAEEPDKTTPADLRGDAIIYLAEHVDVDGVLGYHDKYGSGIPSGYVFTALAEQLKEPWSVMLSHEALELIGDAEANLLVSGPHPTEERNVFHWFEMCDAVQNESYEIDGVAVSNFVLPLYFTGSGMSDEAGARNDFLGSDHGGKTLTSFGVNPGGYIGFFDPQLQRSDSFTIPKDARAAERMKIKGQVQKTRRSTRYRETDEKTHARTALAVSVPQTIAGTALKAGDVLLAHGTNIVSKAIMLLDGSPVSHAALYLGDGAIAEATGAGVKENRLTHLAEVEEWVLARRLVANPPSFGPVLDRARFYIAEGNRYAFEQILILAFLCITRRLPVTPSVGLVVRKVLDSAAEALNRFASTVTAGKNKQPMICSELVYRSYAEAQPAKPFAIAIGPVLRAAAAIPRKSKGYESGSILDAVDQGRIAVAAEPRLAVARAAVAEIPLEEVLEQYTKEAKASADKSEVPVAPEVVGSLTRFATALHRTQAVAAGATGIRAAAAPQSAIVAMFAMVKDFVTPGDLLRSTSLRDLGRVEVEETRNLAALWQGGSKLGLRTERRKRAR